MDMGNDLTGSTGRLPIGSRVKDVLALAYKARRPVLLEGETGIGKSEIVEQTAKEMGIKFVVLDLSLLEPPDLIGLPIIRDGRTTYACPQSLPTEKQGILVLEELNRADRYMQQPALQLLTARRLHDYELPEGWSACAAINPEHGDYQVTPLDPALRSRFMNLKVYADRETWLAWAQKNNVHGAVLSLARLHDRFLDDTSPRTWTYVSEILHAAESVQRQDTTLLRDALSGYLPEPWVQLLIKSLKEWRGDSAIDVDVRSYLQNYHCDSESQNFIRDLLEQGRTDRLSGISNQLLTILGNGEFDTMIGRNEFNLKAFEALISDLPGDHGELIQEAFGENPVSGRLIDVKPEALLNCYRQSAEAKRVEKLISDPSKLHHIFSLVTGLCNHLEKLPAIELNKLRRNIEAKLGLGLFIEQIGHRYSAPVVEKLQQLQVEPMSPKGKRRKSP